MYISSSVEDYGRATMSSPLRQGLIYRKAIVQSGRSVTFQKMRLVWCIVSTEGIFFFDHRKVEASKSKTYILTTEAQFSIKDIPTPGRFQFEVKSKKNHYLLDCLNFTDKMEWKKAIEHARTHRLKSPSSTTQKVKLKAEVNINIKEAKNISTGGASKSYCSIVLGHSFFKTKIQPSQAPKWNEKFKFSIHDLPIDILIIMYDKASSGNVIGFTPIKIETAGERGDVNEWFDVRSIKIGQKAQGKVFLNIQVRYDEETQKRVTFGVRLKDIMSRESHKSLIIPDIAFKCIEVINKRGLKSQGIFRVPGNRNKMRDYETRFDIEGINIDFAKKDDEHMVASIFKMFLRDMPEPIIPYESYKSVVDAASKKTSNEVVESLKNALKKIPNENYRLLFITCCLLYKITQHVDQNYMKPTNLAIVFGPVFCSPPPESKISKQEMLKHLPALSGAAERMITDYKDIFEISEGYDPIQEMLDLKNKLEGFTYGKKKENGTMEKVNGNDETEEIQE